MGPLFNGSLHSRGGNPKGKNGETLVDNRLDRQSAAG